MALCWFVEKYAYLAPIQAQKNVKKLKHNATLKQTFGKNENRWLAKKATFKKI
jgi:hypothetical protein